MLRSRRYNADVVRANVLSKVAVVACQGGAVATAANPELCFVRPRFVQKSDLYPTPHASLADIFTSPVDSDC